LAQGGRDMTDEQLLERIALDARVMVKTDDE
jgi:hypothetical protein